MKKIVSVLIAGTVLIAGCQQKVASVSQTNFFDRTSMDTTVSAGDDFYQYANGSWIKSATIPDEYPGWGSFMMLYVDNLKKLNTMLEGYAKKNNPKGSLEQKAGDFYTSGMDTIAIDKLGAEPLKKRLAQIDAAKTTQELLNLLAEGFKTGEGDLLGFGVGSDEKNSSKNIAIFSQASITLPEKGYYERMDSSSIKMRAALKQLAITYFKLTGSDEASAVQAGNTILALETKIAASHRTPEQLRDPASNYNKMSVTDAEKLSPNIGWKHMLSIMGVQTDSLNLSQPGYYKGLSDLLASEPLEVWKTKVKFDYINSKADFLSKNFSIAEFQFKKEMSGAKKMPDRWKQVVNWSDGQLQDVVGQLYVKEYFPPESKQRMDELVDNLQKAFKARIDKLDWMSDVTKQKAQVKLAAFLKKIGYPTKWKDFRDVTIDKNNFFGNTESLARHYYKESLSKVNKPVDRTEWGMTPSTVNAYYNPSFNEIVFPAGILQFPFFHPDADDAINYGAIGLVIGHEMTHGFDDQGCQYDADGNMKNWWLPADSVSFKAKTASIVNQFNGYVMLDTMHVNGQLTLGENIADLGGLAIAYDAFKLTKQGQSTEKIDGFTPDERFFFGFAQVWRSKNRPEIERTWLNVDPHSPDKYRVMGPLSNFQPFYNTFHVPEKSKMYRSEADRIKVW